MVGPFVCPSFWGLLCRFDQPTKPNGFLRNSCSSQCLIYFLLATGGILFGRLRSNSSSWSRRSNGSSSSSNGRFIVPPRETQNPLSISEDWLAPVTFPSETVLGLFFCIELIKKQRMTSVTRNYLVFFLLVLEYCTNKNRGGSQCVHVPTKLATANPQIWNHLVSMGICIHGQ